MQSREPQSSHSDHRLGSSASIKEKPSIRCVNILRLKYCGFSNLYQTITCVQVNYWVTLLSELAGDPTELSLCVTLLDCLAGDHTELSLCVTLLDCLAGDPIELSLCVTLLDCLAD